MSTYTPIATETLTSTATSITLTGIPQYYTDLILQVNDQVDSASGFKIRFNGDSAGSYQQVQFSGYGTGVTTAGKALGATSIYNNLVFGDSTTANAYTPNVIHIENYSNSTSYKSVLWRYGNSTQAGGSGDVTIIAGSWNSTSPITSIEVSVWNSVNFVAGTSVSLYGIAAGSATAKASGGVVTTDGTYAYHTFTTSGAFFPYENLNADYLVVSGGGAGGRQVGGGGGGGGVRCTVGSTGGGGSLESPLAVIAGRTYPVLVGAGASAAGGGNIPNASNSSFGSIITLGGGSANSNNNGKSGGSGSGGGGGNMIQTTGGAGTAGQGFAGGTSIYGGSGDNNFGAGGGGAGAVGTNGGPGGYPGNGGNGVTTSISGTSVTYGGGGGGGSNDDSSRPYGTGGTGGGGRGGAQSTGNQAVAGTAFLGGAGGGAGGGNAYGASGGSGIVIIRYAL